MRVHAALSKMIDGQIALTRLSQEQLHATSNQGDQLPASCLGACGQQILRRHARDLLHIFRIGTNTFQERVASQLGMKLRAVKRLVRDAEGLIR